MAATVERFCNGQSVGVGALPHRDARAAAEFSIAEFDVATVPAQPDASLTEAAIAQADAPDLTADAFSTLWAFLDHAVRAGVDGSPVSWQFVGPITRGFATLRPGIDAADCFRRAADAVCRHTAAIGAAISEALPSSPQLMLLDEPRLGGLTDPDLPISPDSAIDLLSSAMAALPHEVAVGVHCCTPCDLATMLASGPDVISIPVSPEVAVAAGNLERFIHDGGVVAWGVVPTVGPIPDTPDRGWRELSELWCTLVQHGVDAAALRQQSLVSPRCGLAAHDVATARRVVRLTAAIGHRVNAQAISTKLAFGA